MIAHAFPGRSIFICVPMVMKSSIASMEAVLVEAAARPEGRARPYRSRKPPASSGAPKTGRPAMISLMNLVMVGTFLDLKTGPIPSFSFSLPREANLEMKSQPGTLSRSVCFWIFGALRHIPSPITNRTPPRILGSSMFRTRPYPAHSIFSVDSPLIMIGHARTISSISAGDGRYCKFPR